MYLSTENITMVESTASCNQNRFSESNYYHLHIFNAFYNIACSFSYEKR